MREILFRGKRRDNGRWTYGFPVSVYANLNIDGIETWDGERHLVNTETAGQYTGMIDKYNTKIFEGDIVKTKYGRLCVVVWFASPPHNGWDLETIRTCDNCRIKAPDSFDLYKKDNLEVIGNIHDNLEMRK